MAATAKAAPDLKRLAGGSRGGRKLGNPVLHYSLSWARGETPDRREMSRAVDGSLEGHEALIVAHDDTRHPHVHVVANRVDPETGKAATGGRAGASPHRGPAAPGEGAWRRGSGSTWRHGGVPRRRVGRSSRTGAGGASGDSTPWARKEWAELHRRQEGMRQRLDRESRTVLGRLRIWRTERSLRELVGAVRGREDLVEGWREDLARKHRDERTALGKAHGGSAQEIERGERESYRRGLVDAERRAWAVRERMRERQERGERESGPSIIIPIPRPRRPRGPERGGGGFER